MLLNVVFVCSQPSLSFVFYFFKCCGYLSNHNISKFDQQHSFMFLMHSHKENTVPHFLFKSTRGSLKANLRFLWVLLFLLKMIHKYDEKFPFKIRILLLKKIRADFLSSKKLLATILLQKKSIMQVPAANILMRISIVKTVCECLLPLKVVRNKKFENFNS